MRLSPTPSHSSHLVLARCVLGCCSLLVLLLGLSLQADTPPPLVNPGPFSPQEELARFQVKKGFRVELAASEPNVVDPVCMTFDERGRIWVGEMISYPNAGVGTGVITSGRIKILEDRDGDGVYETSTIFAEGLRFPMGLQPYKGGVLVAVAPDLLYLKDTTGSGKADLRQVVYTGFGLANIQQLLNSPQWGLDNWVYAINGSSGGTITSGEKPDMPALNLGNRGIRFKPGEPGSLQPTSSGGQYGLTADEYSRWFVNTNSQHLRHIVLPDHYLKRNPLLPVSAVTLDIPEHGAACKVFRISPFEAWRVERTTRRKGDPATSKRLPSTELVPGGYITSACSPMYYSADLFPPEYRGNIFVCDPANNLIHRDVLSPNGATFIARRGDAESEFLASTDNWFRPVCLTVGPDGAMYVLDFYREVIETPLSLPDDIKQRLNLETRGRGRIWRVVPEPTQASGGRRPPVVRPNLDKASAEELVKQLANPNRWWRITAQRLLVERQDKSVVAPLRKLASEGTTGPARVHALWTLEGLGGLTDEVLLAGLKDSEVGVREQALRLVEPKLASSQQLRQAAVALADDPSPRVRFQAAFSLGEAATPETAAALARIARQDAGDPWTQTAILSSVHGSAAALLDALVKDPTFLKDPGKGQLQLLRRVAGLIGARQNEAEVGQLLALAATPGKEVHSWQFALLEGLGQGLQLGTGGLAQLWDKPPAGLREVVGKARGLFEQAAVLSRDSSRSGERVAAIQLLGHGPFVLLEKEAPDLLAPQAPAEVQLAAVRALALHARPRVAELLLQGWAGYSPVVRREVSEALFARPDRLIALLDAVEQKKVLPVQLEPVRIDQLRKHTNARIRQRATKLFAGQLAPDRQKVVQDYQAALELKAEAARGKMVFKRVCSTCHRLENEGTEVGPDLLATLGNKSRPQMLIDILDPSREVDSRYLNYIVVTRQGKSLSGLVAAETASSLTLRRGDKAEDTILRTQIDEIQATGKSLMPDGLESQLTRQDLADLIEYLQGVARPK